MQLNGWDHALKVTADGKGLVGHAGAILLRKAADAPWSADQAVMPRISRPRQELPIRRFAIGSSGYVSVISSPACPFLQRKAAGGAR